MVRGLDIFRDFFAGFENQYVLIGGTACDILFSDNESVFRATRDMDIVLIVEALTPEFGERIWKFIQLGQYRNKSTNAGRPQFYRFDKPEKDEYPKMLELFARADFELKEISGLTPIHIDDEVSSLSAILLDEDYYKTLLTGRTVINGVTVLRPEYLILFKARAYLDLRNRKEKGENIDSRDVKKHKNDILRISMEFLLQPIRQLPQTVHADMKEFIKRLEEEPFDTNLLKEYRLENSELIEKLYIIYMS